MQAWVAWCDALLNEAVDVIAAALQTNIETEALNGRQPLPFLARIFLSCRLQHAANNIAEGHRLGVRLMGHKAHGESKKKSEEGRSAHVLTCLS